MRAGTGRSDRPGRTAAERTTATVAGVRRARSAVAIAAFVLASGCEAAPAPLPILTDPMAVMTAGLEATARLHGVHLRVDVSAAMANEGGTDDQRMEIDVDLDSRSFSGRSVSAREDGTDMTNDFVATGGLQYSRSGSDARWNAMPDAGRAPVPPNQELVRLVTAILARDTADVRLAEPAACNDSTCYHVVVGLDADAATELLGPVLTGGAVDVAREDRSVTATSIDVYIDRATRQLIAANAAFRFAGTGIRLAIVLSNHDVPVQIVPPPPGQVDGLLDNVGGRIPDATVGPPSAAESP